MQNKILVTLESLLASRGYKVLELTTYSGGKYVGTNIEIKFNNLLLTNCVYCDGQLFSTCQNISDVRILFFN